MAGRGRRGWSRGLFQGDVADPASLTSIWALPDGGLAALEYVRARVMEGETAAPAPEPQASARMIAAMDAVLQTATLQELMHRQTAILLRPGQPDPMTPLYREVAISTAALETRLAASGQAQADPFLFSHLAGQLDRRMLSALLDDVPAGGPLVGGLEMAALHLNLSLTGILSDRFAVFAEMSRQPVRDGLRIGVEVPFVEAFADPKGFVLARERIKLARMRLVLDGVTHHALLITDPGALKPDLVKLNWSPAMTEGGAALREAVGRVGVGRMVLHRAESEAALAWGIGHGIMRFQGRYVDQMLGAERLRGCSHAGGCVLRQCVGRAATISTVGRAGCGNLALLDQAMPLGLAGAVA